MHVWNTDFGSCNYTVTIAMENSNSSLYNKKTYESRMMLISVFHLIINRMEEEKSFLKICRHIGKYTIPDVFRKLPFKLFV